MESELPLPPLSLTPLSIYLGSFSVRAQALRSITRKNTGGLAPYR
jgi:hypothetical protein